MIKTNNFNNFFRIFFIFTL